MKYFDDKTDVSVNGHHKLGVLLINLGTPQQAVCPALRRYLSEFLMDSRVIELPWLLRSVLVKGIIVNARSHKSAATYRKIWTDQGSPLLINTENLTKQVALQLANDKMVVEFAMRYSKPDIKSKIQKLHQQGVRDLIVS